MVKESGQGHCQYPILSFPISALTQSVSSGQGDALNGKKESIHSLFDRANDLFAMDESESGRFARPSNFEKSMMALQEQESMNGSLVPPSPTVLKVASEEGNMGMKPVNLFDAFLLYLKTQHTSSSLSKCRLVQLSHPDFKIGSLDALISLTDNFNSLEVAFDNLLSKCRNNARTLFSYAKQHETSLGAIDEELYINDGI